MNKLLNTSICALSVCFCGKKTFTLLSFIVPLSRRVASQPLLSKIDVWDPTSTAGPSTIMFLLKFSIGKNWHSFHSPSMKTFLFAITGFGLVNSSEILLFFIFTSVPPTASTNTDSMTNFFETGLNPKRRR